MKKIRIKSTSRSKVRIRGNKIKVKTTARIRRVR